MKENVGENGKTMRDGADLLLLHPLLQTIGASLCQLFTNMNETLRSVSKAKVNVNHDAWPCSK